MCLHLEVFCDLQSTKSVNKPYKMLDNSDTISPISKVNTLTLRTIRIPVFQEILFLCILLMNDEYTHIQHILAINSIMFRISSEKIYFSQQFADHKAGLRKQTDYQKARESLFNSRS